MSLRVIRRPQPLMPFTHRAQKKFAAIRLDRRQHQPMITKYVKPKLNFVRAG
jgi:hypothetical protein